MHVKDVDTFADRCYNPRQSSKILDSMPSADSNATTQDVCEYLREHARPTWDQLFSHPFVLGMADGTLPVPIFAFYISQNILFQIGRAHV